MATTPTLGSSAQSGDTSAEPVVQRNFYKEWVASQEIPVVEDYFIQDVNLLELERWAHKGGRGVFLNLIGTGDCNDAYICEIPPGKSLNAERHIYEEMIFILKGSGATTVWVDGSAKHTFEWQEGSLFSPPLNTWHELHNGRGNQSAKFLAVTSAPLVINLYHSLDFVFNNPYVFRDRYQTRPDFSAPKDGCIRPASGRATSYRMPQIFVSLNGRKEAGGALM
jgi:mannose-6-phosphate isomerase-like protein (cupin superfamily)